MKHTIVDTRAVGSKYQKPLVVHANGKLTAAVGGKPSEHMGKVRQLEHSPNKQTAARARYFAHVLDK